MNSNRRVNSNVATFLKIDWFAQNMSSHLSFRVYTQILPFFSAASIQTKANTQGKCDRQPERGRDRKRERGRERERTIERGEREKDRREKEIEREKLSTKQAEMQTLFQWAASFKWNSFISSYGRCNIVLSVEKRMNRDDIVSPKIATIFFMHCVLFALHFVMTKGKAL